LSAGFCAGYAVLRKEIEHSIYPPFIAHKQDVSPSRPDDDPGKLIVVDGSGEVGPARSWDLVVPLWAEVRALSWVICIAVFEHGPSAYEATRQSETRLLAVERFIRSRLGHSKVAVSISLEDNPSQENIYGFPKTEHAEQIQNRYENLEAARVDQRFSAPTSKGSFYELSSFCAKRRPI